MKPRDEEKMIKKLDKIRKDNFIDKRGFRSIKDTDPLYTEVVELNERAKKMLQDD